MKEFEVFDLTFNVGKNKDENDFLVKNSNKTYTWFHLKDYPSCHGVINETIENLDSKVIYKCATIIKNNTKYKNLKNLYVNYISISNIKPTDYPGKVILMKKPKKIRV